MFSVFLPGSDSFGHTGHRPHADLLVPRLGPGRQPPRGEEVHGRGTGAAGWPSLSFGPPPAFFVLFFQQNGAWLVLKKHGAWLVFNRPSQLPSGLRPFFSLFFGGKCPLQSQPTKQGCPLFLPMATGLSRTQPVCAWKVLVPVEEATPHSLACASQLFFMNQSLQF